MNDEILDESKRKAIGFGTITFLVGILVASITMFTFMEGRIAKEVQESMRLAQLEQKVKSQKEAIDEKHNFLSDKVSIIEDNMFSKIRDVEKNVYNELQNNLMLFYTGQTRSASLVLKDQKNSFLNEKSKFDLMIQMTDLVESAKNYLVQSDLRSFGNTLDLNWNLKRSLSSKISNNNIDDIYGLAKKNGAIGGKLLGAGGSGFMLFYCEKENQNRLRRSLKRLREFDFQFDNIGSKIIYND